MTILVSAGCGEKETKHGRFHDEIMNRIKETNPDIMKLSITDFAVTDSVTTGQQMRASRTLFQKKKDYLAAMADRFWSQKKKKNARLWEAKAAHADSLLVQIDSLFTVLQKDSSNILYYCCRFSGEGKRTSGTLVVFENWHATVTPDGRVFNIISDQSKLKLGMGSALPGYTEVTKGENIDQ